MSLAEAKEPSAIDQLALYLARKGRPVWPLSVAEIGQLTPRMTRVAFHGATLDHLDWKRGQDLVLELPQVDRTIARRHYTIRDLKDRRLTIDFVHHGDSASSRWLRRAEAGSTINASGPRGRTYLRKADWQLFVGDETALPAIFAMMEGAPANAQAFVEIAGPDECQPAPRGARVEWLSRDGAEPSDGQRLLGAVANFTFPPGRGHAYVIGQTASVRAVRQALLARGMAKEQICAEGYWRPGRTGGHDHV